MSPRVGGHVILVAGMRLGVFAIVACCGRAKVDGDFVEPAGLITVVENGSERRVVAPEYEMRFHGGEEREIAMNGTR